jgi:phosphonate transport system substrate-binding protein
MTKNLIGKCGVLAAGMVVLGLASTLRAADQKVVVALKPDKNPDQMIEEKKALADFLSPKLGKPVEVIIPTSSAVIIEGFANGTIDVAYLSSLDMINARKAGAAEILLAGEIDGKTSYQSYWVTLKEKPYKSVEELKGKPIAFASRTSTSGYIIPMWDLKQKGLISEPDPEQFFGAGNVSYGTGYVSAIERVLNGQVEAAAVSYYVLDKDKHLSAEQRAQLRNLAEQGPVPTHVLAVRTGIAAEDRHKLKEALVSLNEEEHVSLRDRLFTSKLMEVDADAHLGGLNDALEFLGISR